MVRTAGAPATVRPAGPDPGAGAAPGRPIGLTDPMVPGSAAWWERRRTTAEPPRRPRANGLSLDRILDAALAIVDAEGLDALTMRRLADHLGTSHPALYRHVAGHDEIVVLLVDRVLAQVGIDLPDAGRPAVGDDAAAVRARAEAALRRYRAVLLEHPALTPAFLRGQMLGPNAMTRREEALRLLLEVGADPELAARAYLVLTHFVITSAVFEASGAGRSAVERAAMRSYFYTLPAEEYPPVTALAGELTRGWRLAHFRNTRISLEDFAADVALHSGNTDPLYNRMATAAVFGQIKRLIDDDLSRKVAKDLSPEVRELWNSA